MSYRKTVRDIDVNGKKVFLRAGLDVPLDPKKDLLDPERVTDATRIMDIMPTLTFLIENNCKIVLAAGWCGRPKGEDPDYSMAPVAKKTESILKEKQKLKHPVLLAPNCFADKKPRSVYKNQDEVRQIVANMQPGQVCFLENVRYDREAKLKDRAQHMDFATFYASLVGSGAIYVNEAETQNHRPEATIITTPIIISQNGGEVCYGFKYADVLDNIGDLRKKLTEAARGPFVFGLCGKKIESDPGITSKITVAKDLLQTMQEGDTLIIGGAVIYTFLLAEHYAPKIDAHLDKVNSIVDKYDEMIIEDTKSLKDKDEIAKTIEKLQNRKSEDLKSLLQITDEEIKGLIGSSYLRWGQEGEQIVFAHSVMAQAKSHGIKVITAMDHTISNALPSKSGILPVNAEIKIHPNPTGIPQGFLAVAEGPKTLEAITRAIESAKIYLQSGPYSIEDPRVETLSHTDQKIFDAVRICRKKGGVTIAAGGDTTARVNASGAQKSFTTITSAGGATLELINGFSKGRDAVEEAQRLKK